MPIPDREVRPTDRPDLMVQVTDDGSFTFLKTGTADSFHSGCGALSESKHVYLENSGVGERLRQGSPARVLEIGLGTSMTMLATLDLAWASDASLQYVALETDWISASTLEYLEPRTWVQNQTLLEQWLAFRQQHDDSVIGQTCHWTVDAKRDVAVVLSDVLSWIPAEEFQFDAIYFDPFCPESCPDLWSTACFQKMRRLVSSEGCLATYSCSRIVRDALEHAGWRCERVPGPTDGKREVLVAYPA